MNEIEILNNKNKNLREDIINNKKNIYRSVGIILIALIASLGGGVLLGFLLGKIVKAVTLSIGIAALISVKPIADIINCNKDIQYCNDQIMINKQIIKKYKNTQQQEIDKLLKKDSKKSNNYKYEKMNQDFNNYLNGLKNEGFFDYNDDNHKKR